MTCAVLLAGCEPVLGLRPEAPVSAEDIASTAVAADRAYREENWIVAERSYRRLTELAPRDAEHWFRLGNVYAQTNRPGDAVRMYGEALNRDARHTGAWHNLGMTQLRLATRSFENLEARTPESDPAHARARHFISAIETAVTETGEEETVVDVTDDEAVTPSGDPEALAVESGEDTATPPGDGEKVAVGVEEDAVTQPGEAGTDTDTGTVEEPAP